MVDYSKWDKLDLSDDENEDEKRPGGVRVRRVEAGSRIVIGKEGDTEVVTPSPPKKLSAPPSGAASSVAAAPPVPIAKPVQNKSKSSLDYSRFDSIGDDVDSESEDDREYYEDEAFRARKEEDRKALESTPTAVPLSKPTTAPKPTAPAMPTAPAPRAPGSMPTAAGLPAALAKLSETFTSSTIATENLATQEKKSSSPTHLGYDAETFMWSQTKDEVVIRVRVPAGTRASQVSVSLVKRKLKVYLDGNVVVDAVLAHSVKGDGDTTGAPLPLRMGTGQDDGDNEDEDNELDWELQDLNNVDTDVANGYIDVTDVNETKPLRAVCVTLIKRPPTAMTATQWWTKMFETDTQEADLSALGAQRAKAASRMQQVWEEAHVAFRAKVKNIKKTEVHI